jgi:hypothetical protein
MASRRNLQQDGKEGVVTHLCSINSTGLVFVSNRELGLSSEVSFSIETRVFGLNQEWSLQGWVVECRHMPEDNGAHYQVTLLFSDFPKGLQHVLAMADSLIPSWRPRRSLG